jgi:hypothetical protein
VAPFLSAFVRNASKNMLICFLILWFYAVVIFPALNGIIKATLDITEITKDLRFEFVSLWVGFFIAGYVLKDVVISKRWAVMTLIIWLCLSATAPVNGFLRNVYADSSVSFLFIFLGKYVFSIASHQVVLTLLAFLTCRSLGDLPSLASSRFGKMVTIIAPLTFGLYLCHHLILIPTMEILERVLHVGSAKSGFFVLCTVPTLAILFFTAAAGLVYMLRRSRYLKFLAP